MATALRSTRLNPDAYGLAADAKWPVTLITLLKFEGADATYETLPAGDDADQADWAVNVITYDPADLQGSFRTPQGDGSCIGLWLASYELGDEIASGWPPGGDGTTALDIDPTDYVVDEAAGDAAYMFRRGFVAPPGERERAYP
jgi:hypothetical protein